MILIRPSVVIYINLTNAIERLLGTVDTLNSNIIDTFSTLNSNINQLHGDMGNLSCGIGDVDAVYLLKTTSWNSTSVAEFQQQLKDQVNQDISQQSNNNQSHRLILPGKCGEFDLLEEYDNRIAIGLCATGIFKPYSI